MLLKYGGLVLITMYVIGLWLALWLLYLTVFPKIFRGRWMGICQELREIWAYGRSS